jgi:hypothetical protein
MDHKDKPWHDWRRKIETRLRALGCATVTAFLAKFPAEPYIRLAERLGDDIAALQLEWIQFGEATDAKAIRYAAIDSLTRELRYHLPDGWRQSANGDFQTASAYADWIVRVEQKKEELRPRALAVWKSLEELRPPVGWLPKGPDDSFIMAAFSKGWPE